MYSSGIYGLREVIRVVGSGPSGQFLVVDGENRCTTAMAGCVGSGLNGVYNSCRSGVRSGILISDGNVPILCGSKDGGKATHVVGSGTVSALGLGSFGSNLLEMLSVGGGSASDLRADMSR